MILWRYFTWHLLWLRYHLWSFLTLTGLRAGRAIFSRWMPTGLATFVGHRVLSWNRRRTAVVELLTKRGSWQGGTAHPVQQRLEPDPHRNPGWWKEWS